MKVAWPMAATLVGMGVGVFLGAGSYSYFENSFLLIGAATPVAIASAILAVLGLVFSRKPLLRYALLFAFAIVGLIGAHAYDVMRLAAMVRSVKAEGDAILANPEFVRAREPVPPLYEFGSVSSRTLRLRAWTDADGVTAC